MDKKAILRNQSCAGMSGSKSKETRNNVNIVDDYSLKIY